MGNLEIVYNRIKNAGRPIWQHEIYDDLSGRMGKGMIRKCFQVLHSSGNIKKCRDGYFIPTGDTVAIFNRGKIQAPITTNEIIDAKKVIKVGSVIYGYDYRIREEDGNNSGLGAKRYFHVKECYPSFVLCEENICFNWADIAKWLRNPNEPLK